MDALRRFLAQLRDYWRGIGTLRRVALVAAVVVVVAALGAVSYLSTNTRYQTLFADLSPQDAAAVRTALGTIPYRLDAGGTAIAVPADRYAEARVAAGAAGVPAGGAGGKGYELFDENTLTMTPFVQSVNYQRALQAELARSITQIEPVQSARVILARPEPTPFVRDQRPPTASVVLKLKAGATLNRATAAGIVSLVARSVEGLRPENVTVVDSAGRLLSDPHAGGKDDLAAPQLEYRQQLEAYLANKAEELLSRHLGPGKAVVRVSADVNFQKLKERRETYSPTDRAVAAERTTTSKTSGGGGRGGVVGAAANVARAGGPLGGGGGGGGGSSSQEEVLQTDYLVSKTTQDVEDGMGAVNRLTIAVLMDTAGAEKAISPADAQELVKQATGFKAGRDEIKLTPVSLAVPAGPEGPSEEEMDLRRVQAYVGIARNVCLALALVTAVALVPLTLLRRRPSPPPAPAAPTPEDARRARVDELTEFARTDPDRAAAVLAAVLGRPPG